MSLESDNAISIRDRFVEFISPHRDTSFDELGSLRMAEPQTSEHEDLRHFIRELKDKHTKEYILTMIPTIDTAITRTNELLSDSYEYASFISPEHTPRLYQLKQILGNKRLRTISELTGKFYNKSQQTNEGIQALNDIFQKMNLLIHKDENISESTHQIPSIFQLHNLDSYRQEDITSTMFIGLILHMWDSAQMEARPEYEWSNELLLDALEETIDMYKILGKDKQLNGLEEVYTSLWDIDNKAYGLGWLNQGKYIHMQNSFDEILYQTNIPVEERYKQTEIIRQSAQKIYVTQDKGYIPHNLIHKLRQRSPQLNWEYFDEILASRGIHPQLLSNDEQLLFQRRLRTISQLHNGRSSTGNTTQEYAKQFIKWWEHNFVLEHIPELWLPLLQHNK